MPPTEQAIGILSGAIPAPDGLPLARKLQESMTQPERDSLHLPGTEALRNGVVLRWRLAAAMDLAPRQSALDTVDKDALNVLLAEVDRVLDALRAAEAQTPEIALAIDRNWETLATDAVKLSERINKVQAPEPAPLAPRRSGEKPALTGKVAPTPPKAPDARRRPKAIYILLGIALLGVGGYHGYNLFASPPVQLPTVPGAPAGLIVLDDARTGIMRVVVIGGQPANSAQMSWMKQQAAKGLQLKELGPGTYVLLPQPAAPPVAGKAEP